MDCKIFLSILSLIIIISSVGCSGEKDSKFNILSSNLYDNKLYNEIIMVKNKHEISDKAKLQDISILFKKNGEIQSIDISIIDTYKDKYKLISMRNLSRKPYYIIGNTILDKSKSFEQLYDLTSFIELIKNRDFKELNPLVKSESALLGNGNFYISGEHDVYMWDESNMSKITEVENITNFRCFTLSDNGAMKYIYFFKSTH